MEKETGILIKSKEIESVLRIKPEFNPGLTSGGR